MRNEILEFFPKESVANWGINEDKIIKESKGNKSIRKTVQHLRNAIAHYRFEYDCTEESVPVEIIRFTDKDNNNNINFEAVLDFDSFKHFVLEVAKYALNFIAKEE